MKTLLTLIAAACMSLGMAGAYADNMKKDEMKQDSMAKKDSMTKKDSMAKKDAMTKKDPMKKDSMGKTEMQK